MRAILLLFIFSTFLASAQLQVHHQSLGLTPVNSINENQFYAKISGLRFNAFAKVTLEPLNFEYLETPVFDVSITSYALIGKKGLAIDYLGENYISNDGFQSMEIQEGRKFKNVTRTSTGLVALGNDRKIYFSDDAETWEAKINSSVLNAKGDLVWGTNDDGQLISSENGGKDWGNPIDISQSENVQGLIDLVNPTTIIVRDDSNRKLHISSDGGSTWKTTSTLLGNTTNFNFVDANYGFAYANSSTIYCTNNGGDTWVGLAQIFPTLPESGTPRLWAVMQGKIFIDLNGNLYYTQDKGETWTLFYSTIGGKFYDIDQKGDVVLIGGRNGYYAISKDGGVLFQEYKWGNEDIMAVKVIDENTYALGDRKGQVLMLYNGGQSSGKKTTSTGNYNALYFDVSANGNTVVSTRIGQPAVSTDGAQNFKFVNVGGGTHFQTVKANGDIIDITKSGIISKVNPGNGQKTELLRIPDADVRRITMADDNVGYVFSRKDASSINVYTTQDGWASFDLAGEVSIPQSAGNISISHIENGHVIVTANNVNEIFESTDFGSTWTSKSVDGILSSLSDYTNPLSGSHFNSSDNFWLITESGILLKSEGTNSSTTSAPLVSINEKQSIRIYPNPAKNYINIEIPPSTKISSYELIDLNGSKITEKLQSNNQTINISNLKNGIYFIRIISDNRGVFTSKFIKN